jgi:hypothetical protein
VRRTCPPKTGPFRLGVRPGYDACREDTMRGKRFTEEQVIGVLKEAEAGAKTADLCRRHGVSEQTILPLEGALRRVGGQ